jgi:hypothetical protein
MVSNVNSTAITTRGSGMLAVDILDWLVGISTAAAAVGTLAAVVVALYLSTWREHRRRPVLKLALDRNDGFGTGPTGYLGLDSLGDDTPVDPVYLIVSNERRKNTAHDVEVLLLAGPEGRHRLIDHRPLPWVVASPSGSEYVTRISVPPGVARKVVLMHVGPPQALKSFLSRQPGWAGRPRPDWLGEVFAVFATYPTEDDVNSLNEDSHHQLRFVVTARDIDAVAYEAELELDVEKVCAEVEAIDGETPGKTAQMSGITIQLKWGELRRVQAASL